MDEYNKEARLFFALVTVFAAGCNPQTGATPAERAHLPDPFSPGDGGYFHRPRPHHVRAGR